MTEIFFLGSNVPKTNAKGFSLTFKDFGILYSFGISAPMGNTSIFSFSCLDNE